MAEAEEATEKAPKPKAKRKKRLPWRSWLRALHRDFGYFVVGLTFIYALSGIAVNHIDDWDANYIEWERTHQLTTPLPDDDTAAANEVRRQLGIAETPTEVFRVDDAELEILIGERTLNVNLQTGVVDDRGRSDRFFFRLANWLHLNRGKKAWTYIADAYAVLLLFLATSGMFMLPGRKGLLGRGAILVALGSALPILYVTLSGGP